MVKRESLSQLHNNSQNANEYNSNGNSSAPKHNNNSDASNNVGFDKSTYNKYTDAPPPAIQLRNIANAENGSMADRRHLEDVTNQQIQQQQPLSPTITRQQHSVQNSETKGKALVIGTDVSALDPVSLKHKSFV